MDMVFHQTGCHISKNNPKAVAKINHLRRPLSAALVQEHVSPFRNTDERNVIFI